MSIKNILNKMFSNATQSYDEYGQPVQKKSIEEHLLEKHLDRERKKKIKAALQYYEKKHYKEMTSIEMPYHKINKLKNKRR